MKYTIHAGHAKQGNRFSGASGIVQESIENRKIKNAVIKYLQQAGQEAADCTVDSGSSQSAIITAIKKKINACDGTTANISIHLNCFNGKAKGTECEIYPDSKSAKKMAENICDKIASLGFSNRGVKERNDLGILKGITNGGINILIEAFFCDNAEDVKCYHKNGGADTLGKVIAEAILQL